MDRPIGGFHQDGAEDWVAELSCGHDQHVRHRPPFQLRPWVLDEAGRGARIGTLLACPLCDRAEPPTCLRFVRSSPEWNQDSVPAALRRRHRLAPGTWGQLILHSGAMRFAMATQPVFQRELAGAGCSQAIPPEVDHEIEPLGSVRFAVTFLAVDRSIERDGRSSLEPDPVTDGGDPACWARLVCPGCGVVLDGSPHRPLCKLVP